MYDVKGQTAGILVRISDDREGRALGVGRQEEDSRRLAERLGVAVTRVYVENDISGSAIAGDYRQEFEQFLADWQSGVFKVPLAYTTGRLTRDNMVAEQVIQIAKATGVSPIYVASPWCDLTTAAGRRMYRNLAVNDAGEAEDIQERVMRKKLQDAREGKTSGGMRTYGYGLVVGRDPHTGKDICDPYQVRPDEVAVLQEGKRRVLAGESQRSIVMDWNKRGIQTARAGTTTRRGEDILVCDGLWTIGKFSRTLLGESYVEFDPTGHPSDCPCLRNPETGGTRVHHNDRHRALWPAIFSRTEHEAMKAMLAHTASPWSNQGRIKGRTYLLSGLVHCGGSWQDTDLEGQYCDGLMYGQGQSYKLASGEYSAYRRRYACKKWDNQGQRAGCARVFRLADPVELLVSEAVLERFDSPEVQRALAPSGSEEAMAEVLQTLAGLHIRREQLAAEYAKGEHEKADYQVMLGVIKADIAQAEAEKKRLMSAKVKRLALPESGSVLRELWQTASLEWRASVIRLVVEKVVIHPGKPGGRKWPDAQGWNFDPDLIEIVWLH